MDKHMIHIDDLVRQRLGGGQEPERPGAWLNMRDLLDKEMPAVVAPRSNRRRIIGYFTGLLLLATASVGGYKLYSVHGAGAGSASGAGLTAGNAGVGSGGSKALAGGASRSSHQPGGNSGTASGQAASESVQNSNSSAHNNTATTNPVLAANSQSTRAAGTHHVKPQIAQSGLNLSPDHNTANAAAPRSERSGNRSTPDMLTAGNTNRSRSTARSSNAVPPAMEEKNLVSSSNSGTRSRRQMDQILPMQPADQRTVSSSSNQYGLKNGTQQAPAPLRYVYDTVETIELVMRRVYDANIQRSIYRIDTLPKGRIVIPRLAPIEGEALVKNEPKNNDKKKKSVKQSDRKSKTTKESAADEKYYASADQNPALPGSKDQPASGPATNDNANEPAPPAKEETKTKVSNFSLWSAKFAESVEKVKTRISGIQMYGGVMGGINASIFTPNSLGGFQVGLTSLIALNDWWSIVAELKYMHRFNTGSSIRDDFMNIINGTTSINPTTVNGKPYKEYLWTDQKVDHYFNYEVVRTVELPLALRYNSNRFYSMGGLNMVYNMKIDAKEVTRPADQFQSHRELRPDLNGNEPFVTNTQPKVKISDFDSRFGIGYLLGAGYMFTPSMYLDFRLVQTFWDNSKTSGAKQVSNDLLRTPSFQLSVGYRFGQK